LTDRESITKEQKGFTKKKLIPSEITGIRYVKEVGLISTAYDGTIKIFDAYDF
jgi:hypothetical protein